MRLEGGWHPYCYIFGMTHTAKLCNRASLVHWKSNEKWPAFFWSELKQLFTYSPIHFLEIKSQSGQPFLGRSSNNYSPIHLFTYFRGGLGV